MRKRAELEHLLQIEKGALEYIASEDGLNFRQLDGRFNRVTAYASLMGQPITLAPSRGRAERLHRFATQARLNAAQHHTDRMQSI